MIMAVQALLNEVPDPTDEDIDRKLTNICRCGAYQRVRAAIKEAASIRQSNIEEPSTDA
jgi:isoquinoline 1-oxidoreductase alpha subunit